MLLLLCRWKDADIMEWQHVCDLLSNVCSKMGNKLVTLQECIIENIPQQEENSDDDWKAKYLALEEKIIAQEEAKNTELEKVQRENSWLQNRLVEKLQQTRLQSDMIDQLKKDLINSVQQTEVSEGRRLCYEHKIKLLEKQLNSYTSQFSCTDQNFYDAESKYEETLALLQKEKENTEKTLQREILQLQTQLALLTQDINFENLPERTSEENSSQKNKEITLLQNIIKEQHLQICSLCKQFGIEVPLHIKPPHLKQLLVQYLEYEENTHSMNCEEPCP